MTGPFAFFLARSMRNKLVRQGRRLRSPRYAIAALIGLVYFVFIFGGWTLDAGTRSIWLRAGVVVGPLLLALLAARWWLGGGQRQALVLTPAETHLLLPAPLSRSQIIRFKVLQAQPALVFAALIGTLMLRGTGLPFPLRVLSLWSLVATLHLHQIAASLVHVAAGEHGRTGVRRNIIPLVLFTTALVVVSGSLFGVIADIRASGTLDGAWTRLGTVLNEPAPRIVLAPFHLLLAPVLAASLSEWVLPFGGALLVLLAHYAWVLRTDAAFEETAAAEGERREEMIAAVRVGGLTRLQFSKIHRKKKLARPWLPLHSTGRSAYAIFWKNVLYIQRSFGSGRFLVSFAIAAVLFGILGRGLFGEDMLAFAGIIPLSLSAALTLFGPLAVRNDLRMDLLHIDLLRTYPVPSRDLVIAEVAAATVALTVPQIALTLVGIVLLAASGTISSGMAGLAALGVIIVLPVFNTLAMLIQNVLALLYPSWLRIGEQNPGGMEAMGQNMMVMIGTVLLLLIAAIPPVIAGVLVGAPLTLLLGGTAAIAGAAAAVLVAAGQAALVVVWLGGLYDRTDPVTAGLLR